MSQSTVTWSTAHLGVLIPGDPPVDIHYFDTHPGRTADEPYTTIILHHGMAWNSSTSLQLSTASAFSSFLDM